MSSHVMAVTYGPKVEGVRNGKIRQTIRMSHKFKEGDNLLLHGWAGKPYRSPWSWRIKAVITSVNDIILTEDYVQYGILTRTELQDGQIIEGENWVSARWCEPIVDLLAKDDGVESGPELKKVLKSLNGIAKLNGQKFTIIRWMVAK